MQKLFGTHSTTFSTLVCCKHGGESYPSMFTANAPALCLCCCLVYCKPLWPNASALMLFAPNRSGDLPHSTYIGRWGSVRRRRELPEDAGDAPDGQGASSPIAHDPHLGNMMFSCMFFVCVFLTSLVNYLPSLCSFATNQNIFSCVTFSAVCIPIGLLQTPREGVRSPSTVCAPCICCRTPAPRPCCRPSGRSAQRPLRMPRSCATAWRGSASAGT